MDKEVIMFETNGIKVTVNSDSIRDEKVEPETLVEDLRRIFKKLFPALGETELLLTEINEGIMNSMYKCWYKGQPENEKFVVRLFNFKAGQHTVGLQDRSLELRALKLASILKIGPSLYGNFQNGLIYAFVPGTTLNPLTMNKNINLGIKIAQMLATYHNEKIVNTNSKYATQLIRWRHDPPLPPTHLTDQFNNNKVNCEVEAYKRLPSGEELLQEAMDQQLRAEKACVKEDIVLCHNDLNLSNVVYDEATDRCTFLDFEFSEMNPAFADIGTHFLSFAGRFLDFHNEDLLPSVEYKRTWLRAYLKKREELSKCKDVKEDEESLERRINERLEELLMQVDVQIQVMRLHYLLRSACFETMKAIDGKTPITDFRLAVLDAIELHRPVIKKILMKLEAAAEQKKDTEE